MSDVHWRECAFLLLQLSFTRRKEALRDFSLRNSREFCDSELLLKSSSLDEDRAESLDVLAISVNFVERRIAPRQNNCGSGWVCCIDDLRSEWREVPGVLDETLPDVVHSNGVC